MSGFLKNKTSWLLGGVWLLVVVIAVGWRLRSNSVAVTPTLTPTVPVVLATPTANEFLANVLPENYDGPLDAPVKLVVFSDFDCPFCKVWRTRDLRNALKEEFGDQLAIVFRHYPVRGDASWTVAEAAQCAAAQGQLWAFHDAWFEQHVVGEVTEEEIVNVAAALALDMTTWQTCRESGQFAAYVRQDFQLAQTTGYPEPPVFFVNGQHEFFKVAAQVDAIRQTLLFACPEDQPCANVNE